VAVVRLAGAESSRTSAFWTLQLRIHPDNHPNEDTTKLYQDVQVFHGACCAQLSRKLLVPLWRNSPAVTYRQAIIDECAAQDIPLNGETNYNKQMTLLSVWLKENGKDVKSFLPLTSHFDDYFNS